MKGKRTRRKEGKGGGGVEEMAPSWSGMALEQVYLDRKHIYIYICMEHGLGSPGFLY